MQILFKVLAIVVLGVINSSIPDGRQGTAPVRRALFVMANHHPLLRLAATALAPHAAQLARIMAGRPRDSSRYRLVIVMDVNEESHGHTPPNESVVIHLNTGYLALTIRDAVPPFRLCFDEIATAPPSGPAPAADRASSEWEGRQGADR